MDYESKIGQLKHKWLSPQSVFLLLMTFSISLSIIFLIISNGGIFPTLFHGDPLDTFMDFFNQLYFCYVKDPYSLNRSIYPALPNLIMHLFSKFIPFEEFILGPFYIRETLMGAFVFMLYNIITTTALVLVLLKFSTNNMFRKIWTIIVLLFSAPYLYMFQRANFILVSLIFLLFFMALKDHNNRWIREFAYISLAIASVIKIYPAIFGLILLKEKKWIEASKTIGYGMLVFVLPFLYMGGIDKIPMMLKNIYYMMLDTNFMGFSYKVNLSNTIGFISFVLNIHIPNTAISIFTILVFMISVFSVFYLKSEWKSIALITSLMSAIPGFSFIYTMVFTTIPLVMFLNSEETNRPLDYVYAFLFLLSLAPLIFINDDKLATAAGGLYRYSLTAFAEGISLIGMLILLNLEGLSIGITSYILRKNSKRV